MQTNTQTWSAWARSFFSCTEMLTLKISKKNGGKLIYNLWHKCTHLCQDKGTIWPTNHYSSIPSVAFELSLLHAFSATAGLFQHGHRQQLGCVQIFCTFTHLQLFCHLKRPGQHTQHWQRRQEISNQDIHPTLLPNTIFIQRETKDCSLSPVFSKCGKVFSQFYHFGSKSRHNHIDFSARVYIVALIHLYAD